MFCKMLDCYENFVLTKLLTPQKGSTKINNSRIQYHFQNCSLTYYSN